ncbi:MAG: hypothetical protein AB1603_08245 [Chloroflexota bacterium]
MVLILRSAMRFLVLASFASLLSLVVDVPPHVFFIVVGAMWLPFSVFLLAFPRFGAVVFDFEFRALISQWRLVGYILLIVAALTAIAGVAFIAWAIARRF